jgi:hypothetical protein
MEKVIAIGLGCLMLFWLTGCGQILGVRKMDAWGLKVDFAEGLDFGAGFNSVDRVDNRRGISPLPQLVNK